MLLVDQARGLRSYSVMLNIRFGQSYKRLLLLFLAFAVIARAENRQLNSCAGHLIETEKGHADTAAIPFGEFEGPEVQVEFIRTFQTSSNIHVRERAFLALYRNYEIFIERKATRYSKLLMYLLGTDRDRTVRYLISVGRLALYKAIQGYNLNFRYDDKTVKPGTYLTKVIVRGMLNVILTRDGQFKPDRRARDMNYKQRLLLFQGRIDELYVALNESLTRDEIEDLYIKYVRRELSLFETRSSDRDAKNPRELIDTLESITQFDTGLLGERFQELMDKAKKETLDHLDSEARRAIATERLFRFGEDDQVFLSVLGERFGVTRQAICKSERVVKKMIRWAVIKRLVDIGRFLRSLTQEETKVAVSRLLTFYPDTILSVAKQVNLTTEQVRTIESRLDERLEREARAALLNYLDTGSP